MRSVRADVRNPLLQLGDDLAPLLALPEESRAALRTALKAMSADHQAKAQKAWRTHKAPMALYHKCLAVYTGHAARLFRPTRKKD
jgi:hypothetical protein